MLPFITAASLLLMAVVLGRRSLKNNALDELAGTKFLGLNEYFKNEDNRRTLLLFAIVFAYILLVTAQGFDHRIDAGVITLHYISYELISTAVLSLILKIFWKKPLWQCFLVSFFWNIALATVFRYGFGILLPGTA